MINARRHTEKLFIYSLLHLVLTGCYRGEVEVNKGELEANLKLIKSVELDRQKSDKNIARALRLAKKMLDDIEGENGMKIVLSVNYLFQGLINDGFELFEPDEYGYLLFCELLANIDTNEIGFDKKDRKAQRLAEQWRSLLSSEGYFL